MKQLVCPHCNCTDISTRQMMEELTEFYVDVSADGNRKIYFGKVTSQHNVGSPEIRCWDCNKSFTFKEFLEKTE